MVKITSQAASIIGESLLQAQRENGKGPKLFRLVHLGEDYAIQVDTQHDGDEVLEHNGEPIMVLSPDVYSTLTDATIDVQTSPEGPRLVVMQA
jgi:hypothetical protein